MELAKLREQIDSTDKIIIENIAKRFTLVEQVALYKKWANLQARQQSRWEEVLESRKKLAKELGLNENMIVEIWNIMHEYAILKEKEIIREL